MRTGVAAAVAVPSIAKARVFGANDRLNMGFIGMGGQGRGDMGGFMSFKEVQVLAVCDVVDAHLEQAKNQVDSKYGNKDCKTYRDFREVIARDDIDEMVQQEISLMPEKLLDTFNAQQIRDLISYLQSNPPKPAAAGGQ